MPQSRQLPYLDPVNTELYSVGSSAFQDSGVSTTLDTSRTETNGAVVIGSIGVVTLGCLTDVGACLFAENAESYVEECLGARLVGVAGAHCEDQSSRTVHRLNASQLISDQVRHGASDQRDQNGVETSGRTSRAESAPKAPEAPTALPELVRRPQSAYRCR